MREPKATAPPINVPLERDVVPAVRPSSLPPPGGLSSGSIPPPPAMPATRLNIRVLFDEQFDFVWRSLRRLGVAEADLDDVTQEVFMVVHRKLHEFEGRSRVTTWLYSICFRVASEHRRRSTSHNDPNQVRDLDPVDPSAGPEEHYEGREAREKLDEVLDHLDTDKRAVFVLYEIDELPVEVIAEMVGIPPGTVYSRLKAARAEFDKALVRMQSRWARASRRIA